MNRWERLIDWFGCKPGSKRGHDGASNTSRCVRCKQRILQDSQGGWFPASLQD